MGAPGRADRPTHCRRCPRLAAGAEEPSGAQNAQSGALSLKLRSWKKRNVVRSLQRAVGRRRWSHFGIPVELESFGWSGSPAEKSSPPLPFRTYLETDWRAREEGSADSLPLSPGSWLGSEACGVRAGRHGTRDGDSAGPSLRVPVSALSGRARGEAERRGRAWRWTVGSAASGEEGWAVHRPSPGPRLGRRDVDGVGGSGGPPLSGSVLFVATTEPHFHQSLKSEEKGWGAETSRLSFYLWLRPGHSCR